MEGLEEKKLYFNPETGELYYQGVQVFIIPRQLLMSAATEFAGAFFGFFGGMFSLYRLISHNVGKKIFETYLPPEAESKKGEEIIELVFRHFFESGWGRYELERIDPNTYRVAVYNFWLGRGMKGATNKPMCALLEGLFASLFERAFGKEATVTETKCVAIGDDRDEFEIRLAG